MSEHDTTPEPESNPAQPRVKDSLITDDLARFNLNLDGDNPDINITPAHRASDARAKIDRIVPAEELIPTPEQAEALKHIEHLPDPETGQNFAALKVNWPELDESGHIPGEVTVFLPAFMTDVATGPNHERAKQIALQMPDRPFMALNQPSQGGSDNLTDEQREALDKDADLAPTSRAMLRMLQAQGVTDLNLVGTSLGAYFAANLAAHAAEFDITLHETVLVEAPNAEATTKPHLLKSFMAEAKYLDLYHSRPHDPDLVRATHMDKPKAERKALDLLGMARALRGGRTKDFSTHYPLGIAGGKLEADLEQAAATQPNAHFTLARGNISLISHDLAKTPDMDGRVEDVIFSGETHSTLESPKAYGAFARQAIELRKSHEG